MAGHKYNVAMPTYLSIGAIARTLFQLITPSTRRLWVSELHISGRSVASTDVPFLVKWVRQTSAGTSGATIVPAPIVESHPAALITVNSSFSSTEPTDAGVIARGGWLVSPVGTTFDFPLPEGEEIEMNVSSRLGLVVICPQTTELLASCVVQE